MPTIVDTLAIELKLDPKQLHAGLASVVEKVRKTKDDYERHAKGFEAVAASLLRTLAPLAAAIIGIGSAIEAIDWSKHAAAAVTDFKNLADVLGMNVEELSKWTQAAEAAGEGGGNALKQAFVTQQQAMQSALSGLGWKDPSFLSALQYYFGPTGGDVRRWLDEKGNLDLARFNRELAEASKAKNESAGQRAIMMGRLGISDPTLLHMYKDLDSNLAKQVNVINKGNADAMKKLQEEWANLGAAATNLGIQVVTNLAKPLTEALTDLRSVLDYLKSWETPEWIKKGVESGWLPPWWAPNVKPPAREEGPPAPGRLPFGGVGPGSVPPTPLAPAPATPAETILPPGRLPTGGIGRLPPTPSPTGAVTTPTPSLGAVGGVGTAAAAPAAPSTPQPPVTAAPPVSFPPTPAAPLGVPFTAPAVTAPPPTTGAPAAPITPAPPPAAPAPSPGPTGGGGALIPLPAPSSSAPPPTVPAPPPGSPGAITFGPPTTSVPSVAPSPGVHWDPIEPSYTPKPFVPAPGESPSTPPALGPRSSIDTSIFNLPQTAAVLDRGNSFAANRPSINTNSNVTIGAMAFHATTNDSMLDYAPSGSDRTLAIGQYSVLANTSLV